MSKILTATQLHKLLISSNITKFKGNIQFNLANTCVKINTTDTVGHSLQSWLKQWLINNDIFFDEPKNTQEFPDFYLDNTSKTNGLLEVKAFNYNASPAFDIANFESYCSSLESKAYRLDADYLIFGYSMNDGDIEIKEIWLKKIWEISSCSTKYPLRVQDKRGSIYNIRPTKWYSNKAQKPFNNKEEFICALYKTLKQYENTKINADSWIHNVLKSYNGYSSKTLNISL